MIAGAGAATSGRLVAGRGDGRLVCNQVLYHLGERAIEHAVLGACTDAGVALQAYSPLGQGRLPGADTPGGRLLAEIADGHGVAPGTVALRFLLDGPPEALLEAMPSARPPASVRAAT